jgi:hypothetical protein
MAANPHAADASPAEQVPTRSWVFVGGLGLLLVLVAAAAWALGCYMGYRAACRRLVESQGVRIHAYLQDHRETYSDVGLTLDTDTHAYCSGTVMDSKDLTQLSFEMKRLFGEEHGEYVTSRVRVQGSAAP